MTNLDINEAPLDPIESLKESISVVEIPRDLIELPKYQCRVVRVGEKILTIPNANHGSTSGVTIRSGCENASLQGCVAYP